MPNHRWTEADDIAALYVYRFGPERLGMSTTELARSRGIKAGSFRMRVKNFQALDGRGGLKNWADQSAQVYDRFRNASEETLQRLVQR
ncbi:MAG TPA: hypothetical protein VKB93_01615 [Thermoanaerobaculia bacterium]|nr:hypothetical protein [Thermoanaerobaculia bacterium]